MGLLVDAGGGITGFLAAFGEYLLTLDGTQGPEGDS